MAEKRERGSEPRQSELPADERQDRRPTPVGEPDPRTIVAEKPYVSPITQRPYTITETNESDSPKAPAQDEKQGPAGGG